MASSKSKIKINDADFPVLTLGDKVRVNNRRIFVDLDRVLFVEDVSLGAGRIQYGVDGCAWFQRSELVLVSPCRTQEQLQEFWDHLAARTKTKFPTMTSKPERTLVAPPKYSV